MNQENISNKILNKTKAYLNNRTFQRVMDIIRILLFILAIIILVVLLTNIKEVTILNNDVCKLCMEKTGATCFLTKVAP
jgi:hypothetical protein